MVNFGFSANNILKNWAILNEFIGFSVWDFHRLIAKKHTWDFNKTENSLNNAMCNGNPRTIKESSMKSSMNK